MSFCEIYLVVVHVGNGDICFGVKWRLLRPGLTFCKRIGIIQWKLFSNKVLENENFTVVLWNLMQPWAFTIYFFPWRWFIVSCSLRLVWLPSSSLAEQVKYWQKWGIHLVQVTVCCSALILHQMLRSIIKIILGLLM